MAGTGYVVRWTFIAVLLQYRRFGQNRINYWFGPGVPAILIHVVYWAI